MNDKIGDFVSILEKYKMYKNDCESWFPVNKKNSCNMERFLYPFVVQIKWLNKHGTEEEKNKFFKDNLLIFRMSCSQIQ
jgi:hypothetical protein